METERLTKPISTQLAEMLHDLGRLADTYFYDGQLDTAIKVYEAGADLLALPEIGSQDALNFLLHYGKLAAQHGRHTRIGFSKALEIAEQATTLADSIGDMASIAAAMDLTGLIHYYVALDSEPPDFSKAQAYFQRALGLIETASEVPPKTRLDILFHVGLVYQMTEALDEAGRFFKQAYELTVTSGLHYEQASVARHRGYVAYANGDFVTARHYYVEVVVIHDEIGFKAFQPYSLIALGELYLELGELDLARHTIERAAQMAREMGIQRVVESAETSLAQLEKSTSV